MSEQQHEAVMQAEDAVEPPGNGGNHNREGIKTIPYLEWNGAQGWEVVEELGCDWAAVQSARLARVPESATMPPSAAMVAAPTERRIHRERGSGFDAHDVPVELRLHPDDLASIMNACHISSPWLDAEEARLYLRCPLSRVRKLTMTGELPCERDGRRVLYHRDELDAFIRQGGAICP
jgi:excisionase family DNA binding protein